MTKKMTINAVYDDDLRDILKKFGLWKKFKRGKLRCRFTGTIMTFDNIYAILPENDTIKLICNSPKAKDKLYEYQTKKKENEVFDQLSAELGYEKLGDCAQKDYGEFQMAVRENGEVYLIVPGSEPMCTAVYGEIEKAFDEAERMGRQFSGA